MAKYGVLAGAAVAAVGAFCSYEARVLHLHSSPGDGFQVLACCLFLFFLVCGESLSSCLFWVGHRFAWRSLLGAGKLDFAFTTRDAEYRLWQPAVLQSNLESIYYLFPLRIVKLMIVNLCVDSDFHHWDARLQGRFLYLKFSNRDDNSSMWLYYSNMQWAQFFRDSSLCSKILIPWLPFFIVENEQPQPEVCGPGNFCNSFRAVATQFCQLMSRIIYFILLASWEHPLGHWFSLETPCVPVLHLSQFSIFSVQSNRPTVYALSRWGCTLIKRNNTQNWYFQFPEGHFSFWFPQEANLLQTFL